MTDERRIPVMDFSEFDFLFSAGAFLEIGHEFEAESVFPVVVRLRCGSPGDSLRRAVDDCGGSV
jgi:hypothetical protein